MTTSKYSVNYKNRPRNARVIIENEVAFFSGHGVYLRVCYRQWLTTTMVQCYYVLRRNVYDVGNVIMHVMITRFRAGHGSPTIQQQQSPVFSCAMQIFSRRWPDFQRITPRNWIAANFACSRNRLSDRYLLAEQTRRRVNICQANLQCLSARLTFNTCWIIEWPSHDITHSAIVSDDYYWSSKHVTRNKSNASNICPSVCLNTQFRQKVIIKRKWCGETSCVRSDWEADGCRKAEV